MTSENNSPGNGHESSGPDIQPDEESPDWEHLARDVLAERLERMLVDEVDSRTDEVLQAIEEGDDPTDAFWTLVSRLQEFSDWISSTLVKTGNLTHSSPRMHLFTQSQHLYQTLTRLGKHIDEEAGADALAEDIGDAREELARTRELLEELEAEYDVASDEQTASETSARDDRPELIWHTEWAHHPMPPSEWISNLQAGHYTGGIGRYRGLKITVRVGGADTWEITPRGGDEVLDTLRPDDTEDVEAVLDRLDELADEHGSERLRLARPKLWLDDGPVVLEEYPPHTPGLYGEATVYTTEINNVFIGATASGPGRKVTSGLEVSPETAEWLAEVLPKFAKKARAGEEWVYNP